MSVLFYRIFLCLYSSGIRVASIFNEKAKLWLDGRKNIFPQLRQAFEKNTDEIIWFHCASLGEFEQGRPLMERLKKNFPAHKILLTFFSPSGYEVHKHSVLADFVFYLPVDSKQNASKFLSIVRPKLIIFIKYEFWYFYLNEIKNRNVALLLVSAVFRKGQPFFKWYGSLYRKMLQAFTQIFVQDNLSEKLLESINIKNVAVCGDTRVDRVTEIANNWQPVENMDRFCKNFQVIVAGSTWTEDDEELRHYVNKNLYKRFIIAPHEIDEKRLKECLSFYKHAILYSEFLRKEKSYENINTIIIDNVGMLSRLYNYATVSFVGGGFGGDGVHNVLEPAVYHKPVVFGPVYEKYLEAAELEECGAAFSCESILEVESTFNDLLSDAQLYNRACKASEDYINKHTGATERALQYIKEKIFK